MLNKRLIKIIISWLLVIMCMLVIFMLSNTKASKSSKDSGRLIKSTIVITTGITNNIGITNYHPSDVELRKLIKKIHNPVREFMHSFEYFVLSILLLIALYNSGINNKYIITFIVCIIYIFSDECHQLFIKGRTFEVLDIFMDTIGVVIGMFMYMLFNKKRGVL